MVSTINGLHLNTLYMIALGPLIYVLTDPIPERMPFHETVGFMTDVGEFFLVGYLLWSVMEWFLIIRPKRTTAPRRLDINSISISVLVGLAFLSVIGYYAAQLEFARSGIGTILIVMKNFMYPCLLAMLLRTQWHSLTDVFFTLAWTVFVIILSAASPWRSDLVLSGFCLLLYTSIRKPRFTMPLAAFGVVILWVILPTLQFKKFHYDEYIQSPLSALVKSQQIDVDARTSFLCEFVGVRLNYAREMAYVHRGVKIEMTPRLGGQTYIDSAYQLIPRVIWPDKPSYNYGSNYTVPRAIGLVDWDDEGTSWGVNAYAEFIMNFRMEYLVFFLPLLFLVFHFIELYAIRFMKTSSSRFLLKSNLFFLMISLVGIVNLGTYIVWCIICLAVLDPIIGIAAPNPLPAGRPKSRGG